MNSVKARIRGVSQRIVPAGYRNYGKYGVFPEDWRITTLGEITSRLRERNGDSTDYPAYSINNQVGFIPQKEQFEEGSYDGLDKSSYRIVERGQFAYNPARINVGSIGVLKDCDKAIISSLYVCFDTSKDVCKSYLENWFRTTDFYKEIIRNTEGSVREYLFYENFSNIRIALPPLEEQKRIAEILECCDRVIRLKRELIEEKKKQKKSLMQKLLNPDSGFRLPEFKGEWESVSLEDCGTWAGGGTPSKQNPAFWENGTIKWVSSQEVKVRLLLNTTFKITERAIQESTSNLVSPNSLIFVTRSGVLQHSFPIAKIIEPMAINQDIKALTPNERLEIDFLQYFLEYHELDIIRNYIKAGTTVESLMFDDFKKMTIRVPEKLEQKAIVIVLSSADHELDLLEQNLTQWELKKKSLMQLLLTGKVRV